jgi:hypothetical protein
MKDELGDRFEIIGKELKETLKTENVWIPQYRNRFLPAFIMGKAKHNNKTGVNKFGSGFTTFKSFGRRKKIPFAYSCNFKTEEEGWIIALKLRDSGIVAPLHTYPSVKVEVELGEVNKLLNKNNNR